MATPHQPSTIIACTILGYALLWLPETRIFSYGFLNSTAGMKLLVGTVELLFVAVVLFDKNIRLSRLSETSSTAISLIVALICWGNVAVYLSEHPAVAIIRQAEWVAHGLFGIMLWSFLQTYPERITWVIRCIPIGFLLYGGILAGVVLLYISKPDVYPWATGILGFDHIRHFGHYAMVAVIFALAPVTREFSGLRSLSLWSALITMTIAWGFLFWTGGRGPLFAIFTSTAVLLALRLLPAPKKTVFILSLTAAAGALLSIPASVPGFGLARIISTAVESGGIDEFFNSRLAFWQESLTYIWQHPWFGAGPDGYMLASISHYSVMHPHNLLIQTMLEWGIPGSLLFFSLLLMGFLRAKQRLIESVGLGYSSRLVALWSLLTLSFLSLLSGTFYFPFSLLFVVVSLAVAWQPPALSSRRSTEQTSFRFGLAALSAFVGILFLLHGLSLHVLLAERIPQPGSWKVRYLQTFPSALSYEGANDQLNRWAVAWWGGGEGNVQQWLQWSQSHTRLPWSSTFLEGILLIESGQTKEGRSLVESVISHFPPAYIRGMTEYIQEQLKSETNGRRPCSVLKDKKLICDKETDRDGNEKGNAIPQASDYRTNRQ